MATVVGRIMLTLLSVSIMLIPLRTASLAEIGIPEVPSELADDPYIQGLIDVLSRWNEGVLTLPAKAELQDDINALLEYKVKNQPFGYETEDWMEERLARFEALPDEVVPKLPLERTASAVLN